VPTSVPSSLSAWPGPLVQLPIQEGQYVAAGELLARIDPRDFENERQWREADFIESQSLFQRVARAFGSGAVSVAERDQVRARYEVAAAELALAEKTLADTELRAPFAGRVARRLVENFQNVQVGQPILILEDISRLEVRIQLPEQDVVQLPPNVSMLGTTVGLVDFEALPGQTFPATVKELDTRADARTNTYRVVLSLPQARGRQHPARHECQLHSRLRRGGVTAGPFPAGGRSARDSRWRARLSGC
jgi:RND family efflux transporter MFP subunit